MNIININIIVNIIIIIIIMIQTNIICKSIDTEYVKISIIHNLRIAYTEFICKKDICIVLDLFTYETYRNKGYGSVLLNEIKKYCRTKQIKEIHLDDCSNNFNKKNNIYIKNGFIYETPKQPEMIFYL